MTKLHSIYVKVLNNETQLVRKILHEMDTPIKSGYSKISGIDRSKELRQEIIRYRAEIN